MAEMGKKFTSLRIKKAVVERYNAIREKTGIPTVRLIEKGLDLIETTYKVDENGGLSRRDR